MAEPDYVYDPEDWEATYDWRDRSLLADNLEVSHRRGQVQRLATLIKGPDKFVAEIVLTRDEEGDPDQTEIRWFDSEERCSACHRGAAVMPLDTTLREPVTRRRNAAMDDAVALAEAAGRAFGVADFMAVPFNPPLCNLRYRLLLWAAITREERLRQWLPEFRLRARNAIACYRALRP